MNIEDIKRLPISELNDLAKKIRSSGCQRDAAVRIFNFRYLADTGGTKWRDFRFGSIGNFARRFWLFTRRGLQLLPSPGYLYFTFADQKI